MKKNALTFSEIKVHQAQALVVKHLHLLDRPTASPLLVLKVELDRVLGQLGLYASNQHATRHRDSLQVQVHVL